MYVQALHTVHALPDSRVAAGRLRDGRLDASSFAKAGKSSWSQRFYWAALSFIDHFPNTTD